jgi:UDP-N-acetylmuramate dehydrogenase
VNPAAREALRRLSEIPHVRAAAGVPLSLYTRFGIGGPADVYAETPDEAAFLEAIRVARATGLDTMIMGGGTNLIVSDAGFRGIVLRYTAARIVSEGCTVTADAGAVLQDLVDYTVNQGLAGLETLAGIPGSVGAAIYGNAGAYGHSISERVAGVRLFDGNRVRVLPPEECRFHYRESIFKQRKDWFIFSVQLQLTMGDLGALRIASTDILEIRNRKFPVTMKCAGSIFKNLLAAALPPAAAVRVPPGVVREGKVPAAWFLEQAGAKGMRRGDIHVADYHANLLYNTGAGTAADLTALIAELKSIVYNNFGIELEEEVQYVGFSPDELRHLPPQPPRYTST